MMDAPNAERVINQVMAASARVILDLQRFFRDHPDQAAAAREFAQLGQDPKGVAVIQTLMTIIANTRDGADTATIARLAAQELRAHGTPASFGFVERTGACLLRLFGGHFHRLTGN